MAGLDLSGIQKVVNSWIVDLVAVTRDNGDYDDQMDPETGLLIPSEGGTVYIGPGMVQSLSGFSEQDDPDVASVIEQTGADYRLMLPLSASQTFVVGDSARVVDQNTETQDPLLKSRRFAVVDLGGTSSFAVVRFLYLKQVAIVADDVPPPPDPITGEIPARAEGIIPEGGTDGQVLLKVGDEDFAVAWGNALLIDP